MTASVDSAAEVALRFVAAINAHDIEAICLLMAEDFVFADSLGRVVKGRETMRPGWQAYFRMFPDYQIAIEDTFVAGAAIALFGTAQGTLSKQG
jgi:ketosteroid isomerase-like protein